MTDKQFVKVLESTMMWRRLFQWVRQTLEMGGLPERQATRVLPEVSQEEMTATSPMPTRLFMHASPEVLRDAWSKLETVDRMLQQLKALAGKHKAPGVRLYACPLCLAMEPCHYRKFFDVQDWIQANLDPFAALFWKQNLVEGYTASAISTFSKDPNEKHKVLVSVHAEQGIDGCTSMVLQDLRDKLQETYPDAEWEVQSCPDCAGTSDNPCVTLVE